MLFTDRDFITIDDLNTIDPDVFQVSSVEEIPTEGPEGFVHQAIEEAANTLQGMFQNFSYNFFLNGGLFAGLPNTLFPFGDSAPPPRISLGQIVVDSFGTTYWSPLKRWIVYLALRNFYQIASNRKIDDKYASKMEAVQKDIDTKYFPALKSAGLPMVNNPVPCPGAVYELNQGTWDSTNVTEVSGGSATGNTYDVAITWLTTAAESAPSCIQTISVDDNNQIHVDISSLVVPVNVLSWKLYVGVTGKPMYYQSTIPANTTAHTLSAITLSGSVVGRGQTRDVELTFINTFFRA